MQRVISSLLIASSAVYATNDLKLAHKELFLSPDSRPEIQHQELTAIDVNTVAPCQYVTQSAFYNLAGIKNGDIT